jgi:L-fuconate dehydratase
VDPVIIREGRYVAPTRPGFSAEMKPASRAAHRFPDGDVWRAPAAVGA